ncbi:MAG: mediator of RNA polymerase II transcription subunit 9, partial [Actinomycetia bacterium]|nr:mediator of RNA polymerase II transcription subunit 9 [Actinomycetes bacterium]
RKDVRTMTTSVKGKYASVRRVDGIESRLEDMADSIASQNEIICELRARLLPVPVDLLGPPQSSPVVRNAVGMTP